MKNKEIVYTSKFRAHYKQRIKGNNMLEKLLLHAVDTFLENSRDVSISDHPLQDNLKGYRTFSVDLDLRVIYLETKDSYVFLDIGSHNEVY